MDSIALATAAQKLLRANREGTLTDSETLGEMAELVLDNSVSEVLRAMKHLERCEHQLAINRLPQPLRATAGYRNSAHKAHEEFVARQ